jgi:hypothetical protein
MLIGTFIVLLTFVVKEVLRDQLKDRSERITETIAAAQRQDPSASAAGRVIAISSELSQLPATLYEIKETESVSKGQVGLDLTNMVRRYVAAGEMVNLVSAVQDATVNPPKKLADQRTTVKADYETLRQSIEKVNNDNKDVKSPTRKNHTDPIVGDIEIVTFELKAAPWQLTVMDLAKRQKKALDDLYRWCTWGSYGLYLVGLLIGLVGSLRGEKLAVAE